MGGLWLGDGSSSSADLQTYTRRIDSEDTDTNVRVYLPELKSISSRPISRTTSQVPSRAQTRHHSRRPTATLPTLDDRDSPMFSLSRPLTRSSATSGGSGYDSSPDMYRDMVPDFVNKEDKAYFERVRQEAREEEESGMTSDDPEDDEEIRRIRGGGKGLGIEKIVDRMVGVTLFDPEDECDDNNKVRERRDPKLLQRKKVQPEQPQVDGWTNPAWLLSFAAKVVM